MLAKQSLGGKKICFHDFQHTVCLCLIRNESSSDSFHACANNTACCYLNKQEWQKLPKEHSTDGLKITSPNNKSRTSWPKQSNWPVFWCNSRSAGTQPSIFTSSTEVKMSRSCTVLQKFSVSGDLLSDTHCETLSLLAYISNNGN